MPRRAKPWFRSSEGTWYATHEGRQVSLGIRGAQNEAAAWRAWEALRSGGRVPSPPTTVHPATASPRPTPSAASPATVSDVIRSFLADAADRVTGSTLALYELYLDGFAKKFGKTPASLLTCPLAEAYSRRPNWGDSTRSVFLAVLARAFYHAERARLIDRTPLVGLRRPPVASRAADTMITAEHHGRLAAAAPPHFRSFLELLRLTGCRPGEAAQLTAADVDWDAGTAVVRHHKTARKGKRRVLYLTPAAVSLLGTLAATHPSGPLLRNRIGRSWTRSAIGMAMRKASRTAGLPTRVAYGYRHAFATDALAAGVPDAQVAALLGHSSTATLHRHYSHLSAQTKVLAAAARVVR